MIKFLLLLLPTLSFAQNSMDVHRWYLHPEGQEILISIDDLHDEKIVASPKMDWGRDIVSGITLKKDVVVAVIDGGMEIEHPELRDHIAFNEDECFEGRTIPPKDGEDKDQNGYKGDCAGWDFVEDHNRPEDQDGHGTHVTGVIRSVMDGVQGQFRFLPLRVFAPDEGRQSVKSEAPLSVRLNKAFEYAISRKVDVIHLSVGWPKSFMTHELELTIKKAIGQGIAVVAAAGNSSQRAAIFPCQMEGVICVGALRPDGDVARFSNWGSQVDVFAPGEKILSTIPYTLAPLHISRKGYDYKNGTSQAAPFVSAAMALLRGAYPDEPLDALYARLMKAADAPVKDAGLKGLFRLGPAFSEASGSFIFPMLKGLTGVTLERDGAFVLKLPVKNYLADAEAGVEVKLGCEGAGLVQSSQDSGALRSGESRVLAFAGRMLSEQSLLKCEMSVGEELVPLRLKVLNKLAVPHKQVMARQDDLLVINTRTGGRSRFLTLNALPGSTPAPYYYVSGMKDLVLYKEDQKLGTVAMQKDCNFLRAWQADVDGDGVNDIMVESMCEKTHLLYQYFSADLKELWPAVKYRPGLTIVNYDDFELIPQKGLPPIFRFLNLGFGIPGDSPWDDPVTSQAMHYYELSPVKANDGWKYDVKVLENTAQWVKSLGLRYLPSWQIFHVIQGKLLVKLGQKTAWVDVKTQNATWAKLDDLLLLGSKKQKLHGSEESVLQSFLTPYEYRGFVMSGVKLRFKQEDRFDPLLDILGTQMNELGYLTVIRSFQRLIYLQYDRGGKLIGKFENVVDRFDFLTAQDLIASVVNLPFEGEMIQVVDGTKVNTNYVDVVRNRKMTSFEIPNHCVTQQPVVMNGRPTLPVFCARTRMEFEMRFIGL